ncbi:MAG TPA: PAS domain S-box protein [Gammaproteobacteria bacterium]|nr:PAS domain S-box protein [Gammaproteobacteria bacterium]
MSQTTQRRRPRGAGPRARPTYAELRAIVDSAPDSVFVADIDGRYTFVNEAGCHLLGLPRGEIVGKTIADFIPPEDVPRLLAARAQMLRGASDFGEWSLRRCDGRWLVVEINARILTSGQWYAVARDISGRKVQQAASEALLAATEVQRRWLQAVIGTMPLAVLLFGPDGQLACNRRAERLLGMPLSPSGGIEQYAKRMFFPGGTPVPADCIVAHRVLHGGETVVGEEFLIIRPDGSHTPILASGAPIRDGDGRILGAIVVHEDVTTLERTREQLQAAVAAREDILAKVAHDLRNPLHAIKFDAGLIEVMARALANGDEVRELASSVVDAARRMSGLVEDLLTVGVRTSGRAVLRVEPVPTSTLLARAARAAQGMLGRKGLRLVVKQGDDLPVIDADADRLLRVLSNLIDNAGKFTVTPGSVEIAAETTPFGLAFSVTNSGDALPNEEIESMFEPFWQAKPDRRGAGLGLSICRDIVEAHGGRIWAEQAKGQRVRVVVALPYREARRRSPRASPVSADTPSRSGLRPKSHSSTRRR